MLTVEQLRQYVTTPLEDAALQGLLTAAYEAIDPRLPSGPQSETLSADGDLFMLSVPASSITSVVDCGVTLDATDYELESAQMVRRLDTGTNPDWRWHRPRFTYVGKPAEAERDRMAIALVKLDLDFHPGLASVRIGEYQESYGTSTGAPGASYADQREAILSSYSASEGAFV